MNNEAREHGHNPEVGYERQDLGAKVIIGFLFGLAIFCVLAYFILVGMYKYLDAYEQKQQPPPNPLATSTQTGTEARQISPEERMKFPEPRLEVNERSQLDDIVLDQERELNSYGWVDQKAGVAHIPIDRAMQLIAQRGLPVRTPGTNPAANVTQPKGNTAVIQRARQHQ